MTNIALIVLDTLRKDVFDSYFDWLPGTRYESAWSSSGWTVPAHGTLFTGRYPSECGVYADQEFLTVDDMVLAEKLQSEGYSTRAFSANVNISETFEFSRGFDKFQVSWNEEKTNDEVFDWSLFSARTKDQGWKRFPLGVKEVVMSDSATIQSLKCGAKIKLRDWIPVAETAPTGAQQALELIKNTEFGDKEFLFLNLMEVHTPYNIADEYRTTDIDIKPSINDIFDNDPYNSPNQIRRAYEDAAQYLSDIYNIIFTELVSKFDYIITLSDHGEMFGRDGLWFHKWGVYPELAHIPLSIYDGCDRTSTVDETVGLIDLYPTIMAMADISTDLPGRDLLSISESNQYIVERHGLRKERVNVLEKSGHNPELIQEFNQPTYGIVFDDGTYGWEGRNNLLSDSSIDMDQLKEALNECRNEHNGSAVDRDKERTVPKNIQSHLEKLGYL